MVELVKEEGIRMSEQVGVGVTVKASGVKEVLAVVAEREEVGIKRVVGVVRVIEVVEAVEAGS